MMVDYLPTQFLQAFVYVHCGLFSVYLNHKNKNGFLFDGVKIHYFFSEHGYFNFGVIYMLLGSNARRGKLSYERDGSWLEIGALL
jgi:hypothetical protein